MQEVQPSTKSYQFRWLIVPPIQLELTDPRFWGADTPPQQFALCPSNPAAQAHIFGYDGRGWKISFQDLFIGHGCLALVVLAIKLFVKSQAKGDTATSMNI